MTPILNGPLSPLSSVNWKSTKACRVSSRSFFRIFTIMTISSPTPCFSFGLVFSTMWPSLRGSGVSRRCSSPCFPFRLLPFNRLGFSAVWDLMLACCESLFLLFGCGSLLGFPFSISCTLALGRSFEYHLTGPAEIRLIAFNRPSGDSFSPPLVGRFVISKYESYIKVSPTNETSLSPHSTRTVEPCER